MVTSQFTKLFYCEHPNIAHIQSGDSDTLDHRTCKSDKNQINETLQTYHVKVVSASYAASAQIQCTALCMIIVRSLRAGVRRDRASRTIVTCEDFVVSPGFCVIGRVF